MNNNIAKRRRVRAGKSKGKPFRLPLFTVRESSGGGRIKGMQVIVNGVYEAEVGGVSIIVRNNGTRTVYVRKAGK